MDIVEKVIDKWPYWMKFAISKLYLKKPTLFFRLYKWDLTIKGIHSSRSLFIFFDFWKIRFYWGYQKFIVENIKQVIK